MERKISLVWRNAGEKPTEIQIRRRLYQASSATALPLGEAPWKRLQVLTEQTVLESATLDFPQVKAETRFLVQWFENSNTVLGTTEVWVYPLDLLKELKPLAGDQPLGVFDPDNQLKPLLKAVGLEVSDLEDTGVENFPGKLAILGPFHSKAQVREDLAGRIRTLAQKGTGVVWIQPPPKRYETPKPSFYTVGEGKGAVVIVQASLAANLAENPQDQLNLIHFARLALHPEPLRIPNSE